MIKERPILFSGAMVKGVLADIKTQTRRVLNDKAWNVDREFDDVGWPLWCNPESGQFEPCICPYGRVGDQLWVREAHSFCSQLDNVRAKQMSEGEPVYYHADGATRTRACSMIEVGKKRPSIFMPRWASRIQLEVSGVRVERLQDISNEDAMAEGIVRFEPGRYCHIGAIVKDQDDNLLVDFEYVDSTAFGAFRKLWESINGTESWCENPWVWAVDFRKV